MSDHGSPSSQSLEVQSEEEDMVLAQKNTRKLSAEEIKAFRNASLESIAKTDIAVEGAVSSFFQNRTIDCQNWLAENRTTDPLVITGSGLIAFLRYMLSMEQEQADIALKDINEGSAFSGQLLKPGKGMFARIGSSLSRKKESPESAWLTPGEYRAKTVHTESQALRALVLVLQGDVISFVKAGLALRRAYHGYTSLYKEREERERAALEKLTPTERKERGDGEVDIGLDRNSIYSVDFGLGTINIAISILPDGIVKTIKLLGFVGHRSRGVEMVRRCLQSNTLLSPFASALLLALLGALPLVCNILYDSYSPQVRQVVDQTLANPHTQNSLLHLWLIARAELIHRDLEKCTKLMLRCVTISEEEQIKQGMPQLRNFVLYDLMGIYLIQHEWEKAREAFEFLLRESKWSDIFYCYGMACCYEMMAFECEQEGGSEDEVRRLKERASQQYWLTIHQKGTKLGGKIRAPDQIFGKRLEEMLELHGVPHPNRDYKEQVELTPMPEGLLLENTVPLPAYEIAAIFMLALRIPHDIMREMVANIDTVLLTKKLVKSKRSVQEAAEERRLAEQEEGRVEAQDTIGPTEEGDDEEDDEEDFGDDPDEQKEERGEAEAKEKSEETADKASTAKKQREAVLIPLHVAALNQANEKFADTKGKKPANGALAANYTLTALSGMKATFLANSEKSEDRAEALCLIDAILSAPAYKDKAWSLSYVQPNMLYEKACIVYKDGNGAEDCDKPAACEALLKEYDRKYPDTHFYTHSMTEFRVHLAKCEFRNEKKEAKLAQHADPATL